MCCRSKRGSVHTLLAALACRSWRLSRPTWWPKPASCWTGLGCRCASCAVPCLLRCGSMCCAVLCLLRCGLLRCAVPCLTGCGSPCCAVPCCGALAGAEGRGGGPRRGSLAVAAPAAWSTLPCPPVHPAWPAPPHLAASAGLRGAGLQRPATRCRAAAAAVECYVHVSLPWRMSWRMSQGTRSGGVLPLPRRGAGAGTAIVNLVCVT